MKKEYEDGKREMCCSRIGLLTTRNTATSRAGNQAKLVLLKRIVKIRSSLFIVHSTVYRVREADYSLSGIYGISINLFLFDLMIFPIAITLFFAHDIHQLFYRMS